MKLLLRGRQHKLEQIRDHQIQRNCENLTIFNQRTRWKKKLQQLKNHKQLRKHPNWLIRTSNRSRKFRNIKLPLRLEIANLLSNNSLKILLKQEISIYPITKSKYPQNHLHNKNLQLLQNKIILNQMLKTSTTPCPLKLGPQLHPKLLPKLLHNSNNQ